MPQLHRCQDISPVAHAPQRSKVLAETNTTLTSLLRPLTHSKLNFSHKIPPTSTKVPSNYKMTLPNLTNTTLFPSFTTCPSTLDPETALPPTDWFLLAQVKDDMTITKPTLVLSDRDGAPFALVFDGLERDDLNFKAMGLKKGCTAVVRRARRTPPKEEGKRGFVSVEKGSVGSVRAIPGPLERVFVVAERLRVAEAEVEKGTGGGNGGGGKGTGRCETCGGGEGQLMRCTGCGGMQYCSKVSESLLLLLYAFSVGGKMQTRQGG